MFEQATDKVTWDLKRLHQICALDFAIFIIKQKSLPRMEAFYLIKCLIESKTKKVRFQTTVTINSESFVRTLFYE